MVHCHLIISGHVQGVSFRIRARNHAVRAGLKGWIQNRHDGSVEIEVEGDSPHVKEFVEWCNRGPVFANVSDISIQYGPVKGFESFEILR